MSGRPLLHFHIKRYTMYNDWMTISAVLVIAGLLLLQYRTGRGKKEDQSYTPYHLQELDLLRTVLFIEKTERFRIANDLHYRSSSTLAAVKMYLNAVQANKKGEEPAEDFQKLNTLLEKAYQEINKSLYSLMPEVALEAGLDEAVRKFCSHLTAHNMLSIEYDCWGNDKRYHAAFELSVFRFVQMVMNFIVQQATATEAMVQIGMQRDVLTITIEDNGKGYQPVSELLDDACFLHLENSLRKINGSLELRSDNGLSLFIQLDTAAFTLITIPETGPVMQTS